MIGRKYTFLVTIVIMGLSTFLVGILPSYASIGIAAPVILITLRLLQGLALGGEYGGAATYVAEHAPQRQARPVHQLHPDHRDARPVPVAAGDPGLPLRTWAPRRSRPGAGAFRSCCRSCCSAISVWIRLQLAESPLFQQMKAEGKTSKAPITESFFTKNGKIVLLALLGATAGQAVVWYCGQFYALFFLTQTLKIDATTANLLIARRAGHRHAVLHRVRLAVGQDRTQADHHGRLPDRGADLLPDLQGAHPLRQPGHGGGAQRRSPVVVDRRSGDLLVPVRPGRQEGVHATRCDIAKSGAGQGGRAVRRRGGAGRQRRPRSRVGATEVAGCRRRAA